MQRYGLMGMFRPCVAGIPHDRSRFGADIDRIDHDHLPPLGQDIHQVGARRAAVNDLDMCGQRNSASRSTARIPTPSSAISIFPIPRIRISDRCPGIRESHAELESGAVNWYGASDAYHVVGGLDKATITNVAKLIKIMGFNSVRLPFSNQMLTQANVDGTHTSSNPDLNNLSALAIFDKVIEALTSEKLLVILNNHTTTGVWCCNDDVNILWYNADQTTEKWMRDWEMLIDRYKNNPYVIGADLRNEVRSGSFAPEGALWGSGDQNDFQKASTDLGNRLLAINPNLLVVVEGLGYAQDLRGVRSKPVILNIPNRVVYSPHHYHFFGEQTKYYDYHQLRVHLDEMWGYIIREGQTYTAPIWVSEFGIGPLPSDGESWFRNFVRYLREHEFGWCYWPLNVGKQSTGGYESWGLVTDGWSQPIPGDWRMPLLTSVQSTTLRKLHPFEAEPQEIRSKANGFVFDINGRAVTEGATLIMWKGNGQPNQKFSFYHEGSGFYRIINVNSGMSLEIQGNPPTVVQRLSAIRDAQFFRLVAVGSGYYKIEAKSTGTVLSLRTTNEGSVVEAQGWGGSDSQRFELLPTY